jgi:hypothetical protein
MSAVKYYAKWFAMLFGLFCDPAAYSANEDKPMQQTPISFEVIADLNSVQDVEAWAKRNALNCVNQTNQLMEAQHASELNESKRFGAVGRLWLTVNLRKNSIAVHINLFYSKTGGILRRVITIENIYE